MDAKLELPFDVPESLRSYVSQYETDPLKAIETLRSYLRKRGMDAVGHFLLAWLYHQQGKKSEAIDYALKARSFAPGSPLLEHIHYYLTHPKKFAALVPESQSSFEESGTVSKSEDSPSDFTFDLDKLISQLTEAESRKIQITNENDTRNLSEKSEKTDDIATVTLAQIYEKQDNIQQAIKTYKTLQKQRPKEKEEFAEEIKRLKALQKKQGN